MPVLPFLWRIIRKIYGYCPKAHEGRARFIYAEFGMTLRENQRIWYYDKLKEIFPEEDYVSRYQKDMAPLPMRQSQGGAVMEAFQAECENTVSCMI